MTGADLAGRVLSSPPVDVAFRLVNRSRLRILAYHGIHDAASFLAHMGEVVTRYHPVSADQVLAALAGGPALPRDACWVTFDDGDPSVVEVALPILEDLGVRSTMFVCPGVVDGTSPFWWEVLSTAAATGLTIDGYPPDTDPEAVIRHLKSVPDDTRRALVAEVADAVRAAGVDLTRRQVTTAQLRRFLDAGGTVGNHTMTHPCLDTCRTEVQVAEVADADAWLRNLLGGPVRLFAYPNGNRAEATERLLAELGYDVGLLFDHRMTDMSSDRLRLSRLRVNDHTTVDRFRSIVAGSHPTGMHLRDRLR